MPVGTVIECIWCTQHFPVGFAQIPRAILGTSGGSSPPPLSPNSSWLHQCWRSAFDV